LTTPDTWTVLNAQAVHQGSDQTHKQLLSPGHKHSNGYQLLLSHRLSTLTMPIQRFVPTQTHTFSHPYTHSF
jgi:hypothetical protein